MAYVSNDRRRATAVIKVLNGDIRYATFAGPVTDDIMDNACFGDFLGSMTKNVIGQGHSNEYYQKYGAAETEMFANYVALSNGPNGNVAQAVFRAVAPESTKLFDVIIAEKAVPYKPSLAKKRRMNKYVSLNSDTRAVGEIHIRL
jgi:hypothetical protein